jgi:2,4-dienoyl-CoA reductase (NADPH2)
MNNDAIFRPLQFRNLTVKNRIFRSSISGKFDNYDGSGPTHARINWEEKFARGGVGAIITSYVPVAARGRILTNYAMIDRDERIDDWAKLIEQIHKKEYEDCKFIIQLSNSGAGSATKRVSITTCRGSPRVKRRLVRPVSVSHFMVSPARR